MRAAHRRYTVGKYFNIITIIGGGRGRNVLLEGYDIITYYNMYK